MRLMQFNEIFRQFDFELITITPQARMTSQFKRKIAGQNSVLREHNKNLKVTQEDIAEHVSTLIKRSKQMSILKASLQQQLLKVKEQASHYNRVKAPYCSMLRDQIQTASMKLTQSQLALKNIQKQYDFCLEQYDQVLATVNTSIQNVKLLQTEVKDAQDAQVSMRSMIFDYEKLKRVLEQQRRYFKQVSNSEEKSHQERLKQLEAMRKRLERQQSSGTQSLKLCKTRLAMLRIHDFYTKKLREYQEHFIRGWSKTNYRVKLGIKTLQNCLQLGLTKHKIALRKFFYKWHHNIFPKQTLANVVENALKNQFESKAKLSVLNKMSQRLNNDQLSLLHIYQKVKYLSVTANSARRKDLFYGWNRWRDNAERQHKVELHFSSLFKAFLSSDKRWAFQQWKKQTEKARSIERGKYLVGQYQITKEVARYFRKWRLNISKYEMDKIQHYIFNLTMQNKITSRLNYEKRKAKAITTLQIRFTKIQLRNYFYKYWRNTRLHHVHAFYQDNQSQRVDFSELRALIKSKNQQAADKDQRLSLLIFRKFMYNSKLLPYFKKWRNISQQMKNRYQRLLPIILRKQAKNKIHVINEFRLLSQSQQEQKLLFFVNQIKGQIQIVGDESAEIRRRLKQTIQGIAPNKILRVFSYVQTGNQKFFLTKVQRITLKRIYKQLLLQNLVRKMQYFSQKIGMKKIEDQAKTNRKDKIINQRLKKFETKIQLNLKQSVFNGILDCLNNHKNAFARLIHVENVMMFYRMAYAWTALRRKEQFMRQKQQIDYLKQISKVKETKRQNLLALEEKQKDIQQKLSVIFQKFVNFQGRSQSLKKIRKNQQDKRMTLLRYQKNAQNLSLQEKILNNFNVFIENKNQYIFWKGLIAMKYQFYISRLQEELGKMNKKKKALWQKNAKARGDIERRMQDQIMENAQITKIVEFFREKYIRIMNYYVHRHQQLQNNYYLKTIFKTWKGQCQGAKRLILCTRDVLNRNLVHKAFENLKGFIDSMDSKLASYEIISMLLKRRAVNCMRDVMQLWKHGIRNAAVRSFQSKIYDKQTNHSFIKIDCQTKAELISRQEFRIRKLKIKRDIFMAFKNNWAQTVQNKRKCQPMLRKIDQRLLRTAIAGWKWLMFYKNTKRSYLKYKQQLFDHDLKRDVFDSLRIYRQQLYEFHGLIDKTVQIVRRQNLRYAMDKIINVAAYEKDELNYERKKAMHRLCWNLVTKQKMVKRKIMSKWHAWLIPRFHYLPNILHQIKTRMVRSAMAQIKARMYWNDHYANQIADKYTTSGYNQMNEMTNSLIKSGFDPDQVKAYLKKRNAKDNLLLQKVTCHMKVWGEKQIVVRAWHSWLEYMQLKRNIKRKLTKVLNIAGGLGRYWNRWRGADPKFMKMLQKQSRGNMLDRYRDLGRLLKQYRRDLKDSSQYLDQLKDINSQYQGGNDMAIEMALSVFSNNLKSGLKNGLLLWQQRAREMRRLEMDGRFQQLGQGIQVLSQQKSEVKYRVAVLRQQNKQLRQKCLWGGECGKILEKLLQEKDVLSIDLADKQHNMKLLLEDNLRLKQKLKVAQDHAETLLKKVQLEN